jgi:esterase/lipase superfamily enzyme
VTVYHNSGDVALHVSDYTKGNPERLGTDGAARAALLPDKVQQVDCSGIVGGLVEHSYHLDGRVNDELVLSLDGIAVDANTRTRVRKVAPGVQWRLA